MVSLNITVKPILSDHLLSGCTLSAQLSKSQNNYYSVYKTPINWPPLKQPQPPVGCPD